jgi:beta-glucuronidase
MQMIKAAGMNFVRGSHYPQSTHMLDLADELGLLVWDESLGWENPLDSLTNDEFIRRQKSALTRMIHNSVNHPCIVFWGFLNEAITDDESARRCVAELTATVKAEDSSRLVTYATMMSDRDKCLDLVDVVAFNTYPGWYSGTYTFFEEDIVKAELNRLAEFSKNTPELADKPMIISEIGAAALPGDHSGRRWSEEYQSQLILATLKLIQQDPRYCGVLYWQFCNSQVDDNGRIMMRPRGYNNKGLVDEFRKPKLAWHDLQKVLLAEK